MQNNPDHDKLLLFRKTQKLLDRFLFIIFAEDKLLLPPNSISRIVQQWADLKDSYDEYRPLYHRFCKYFGYLNEGYKGKQYEIFPYNGGLFKPDDVLDSFTIDDDVLRKHTLRLSGYDFETDVDVNILGHIFEHSIGEIENVQAEILGETVDRQKTQRKKEGIFYTPKYITKYIVENTVGRLCEDKRSELGIVDEEYTKGRRNRKKATIKALNQKLDDYRQWLLSLTILDPACGSGAFLNQALDFLIKEHGKIDELRAELLDESLALSDISNDILENNIYGVDLNDESVEIAKLSLWLRTAQKGRKLNTLSQNIKCGNSLIDDPAVAGDKAFKWKKEFPEVFENGGFDVVIGNPPYLRIQGLKEAFPELVNYYEQNFKAATGNYDIYALFIEKGFKLINSKGQASFILPHKFLIADFGKGIRGFLVEKKGVNQIVHFGSELVFDDATTYTCIITLSKKDKEGVLFTKLKPNRLLEDFNFTNISFNRLDSGQWILSDQNVNIVLDKIKRQTLQLKDVFKRFVQGIITGKDSIFCVKGEIKGNYLYVENENNEVITIESSILKPHLKGEDIERYNKLANREWLIFPYELRSDKAQIIEPENFICNYPQTYSYLQKFEKLLRNRENGKFNNEYWYQYSRNQAISVLEQPKIITPEVTYGGNMTIDYDNFYHNSKCHSLLLNPNSDYDLKSILPIVNSKLFWFYLSNTGNVLRGGYIGVKRRVLEPFPVPSPKNTDLSKLKDYTDERIKITNKYDTIRNSLKELVLMKFSLDKPSKKLQNWPELEFKDFLKELKKQKVKLSLSEESEWMQYFNEQKQKANDLQSQINQTDREIDRMVYDLYGLTEEEIKIVEESVG